MSPARVAAVKDKDCLILALVALPVDRKAKFAWGGGAERRRRAVPRDGQEVKELGERFNSYRTAPALW